MPRLALVTQPPFHVCLHGHFLNGDSRLYPPTGVFLQALSRCHRGEMTELLGAPPGEVGVNY
jgi:hypothetical protein